MNALQLWRRSEKGKASELGCFQRGVTEARPSVCLRAATRESTTVSTRRSTRLHSARPPPLEIRCFIYFSFYYIYFFFPFFTPLQFFSLHLFLLSPDETARKNNCGIYTLAESKKTIIINYLEKKKKKKEKKCEGGPFSPGRLARLPCGCDKTNRALWVLGLMEFRTSGSSFFFPPFLYLAEDVLGFNEVPPVLNEDSMSRRMGVGGCVAGWFGGGASPAPPFLSPSHPPPPSPPGACETSRSRRLPPGRRPLR